MRKQSHVQTVRDELEKAIERVPEHRQSLIYFSEALAVLAMLEWVLQDEGGHWDHMYLEQVRSLSEEDTEVGQEKNNQELPKTET